MFANCFIILGTSQLQTLMNAVRRVTGVTKNATMPLVRTHVAVMEAIVSFKMVSLALVGCIIAHDNNRNECSELV